ncbi:hypothetical protein [Chakrabartyella piscis]|uniref:hypothetical protein n=1 Tax=Chakrabartyella piscis TaxID=2918914 RepID=UPI00295892F6|nr:hypothetical protein [Chakrabartyella piscis]
MLKKRMVTSMMVGAMLIVSMSTQAFAATVGEDGTRTPEFSKEEVSAGLAEKGLTLEEALANLEAKSITLQEAKTKMEDLEAKLAEKGMTLEEALEKWESKGLGARLAEKGITLEEALANLESKSLALESKIAEKATKVGQKNRNREETESL